MVRSSARIMKSWPPGTRLGEIKTWSISDLKGALTQVICLSEGILRGERGQAGGGQRGLRKPRLH